MLLCNSWGFYGSSVAILDMGSQVLSGTDDLVAISNSTLAVSVLLPGAAPNFAASIGSEVLFSTSFRSTVDFGNLYRTDGTVLGTSLVTTVPNAVSTAVYLTSVGSQVFFVANTNPGHGRELWISDGTEAGTRMIWEPAQGGFSSAPSNLSVIGQDLLFTAYHPRIGREQWILHLGTGTDGLIFDDDFESGTTAQWEEPPY